MRLPRLFLFVLGSIAAMEAHSAHAANLFALLDTGEIYRSSNHGTDWEIRATIPVRDAVALVAETTALRLFLATRSGTVYRSLDGGLNWSAVGSVPAPDVADIVFRRDGRLLLVTRSGLVYLSDAAGVNYSVLSAMTASDVVSAACDGAGRFFALTQAGVVLWSLDQGLTWTARGALTVPDAIEIRTQETRVCVLTASGDFHASIDGGATWTTTGALNQVFGSGLTLDDGMLVAATREGEVARSPNGSAWTWVGSVNQLSLIALANDVPSVSGVDDGRPRIGPLVLLPPYPNPRPSSGGPIVLAFTLPRADQVRIEVVDVLGRRVAPLVSESFAVPGPRTVQWDPGHLGPGIYFVRLATTGGLSASSRFVQLR